MAALKEKVREVLDITYKNPKVIIEHIRGVWFIKSDGTKVRRGHIRLNRADVRRKSIPVVTIPPIEKFPCNHPDKFTYIPPTTFERSKIYSGSLQNYLLPNDTPTSEFVLYNNHKMIEGSIVDIQRKVRIVSPSKISPRFQNRV